MNQFKLWLARMMQGRYGIDPLYRALIGLYLALLVLNLFFRQPLLFYGAGTIALLAFFRVFSKNHARRAAENQAWLRLSSRWRKQGLLFINRIRYYRTHRYRACPSCRTMLKLQKKTGTMTVTCPKCHTTFQVTIRR